MKRMFDLVVACTALVLLAPLMAAIALMIRRANGGPVFFRQIRVGQFGKPFSIYKFRTMVPNAERLGPRLTTAADPRITTVGRWLRKTKLDELPQLFNVLKGEMSLVGPRPEVPYFVANYDDQQRRVLLFRPGITDPASIHYFHECEEFAEPCDPERAYLQKIMPAKIRCNIEYAERRGVVSDAVVLFHTVLRMSGIRGNGYTLGTSRALTKARALTTPEKLETNTFNFLARQLFFNSLITVASRTASIVLLIVSVPVIVACLGNEGYGVWESLMAIAAIMAIFQVVLNGTVLWRVSTSFGNENSEETRRLVRISIGVAFLIAAIIAPLMWTVRAPLIAALRVNHTWASDARWMVAAIVAVVLLGSINQVLMAVIAGSQRAGLAATIHAVGLVVTYGVSLALLINGGALEALFWGYLAGFFTTFVLSYVAASKFCRGLSLLPLAPSRRELTRLAPFAGLLLISNVTLIFRDHTDKILLASLITSTSAGHFAFAQRIAAVVHQVCIVIATPFTAAVGTLHAQSNLPAIHALYATAGSWMSALAGFMTVFVCALREPLLVLWLGQDQPETHQYLPWLLLGATSAIIFSGAGVAVAKGVGRPGVETAYLLVTLSLMLLTKAPCVMVFGALGAVVSSAVSWCFGAAFFLVLLHRNVKLPMEIATRLAATALVILVLSVCGWYGADAFLPSIVSRAQAISILISVGTPLCLMYFSLLAFLQLIEFRRFTYLFHANRIEPARKVEFHESLHSDIAA